MTCIWVYHIEKIKGEGIENLFPLAPLSVAARTGIYFLKYTKLHQAMTLSTWYINLSNIWTKLCQNIHPLEKIYIGFLTI
jgi:hypothetical protein